MSYSTKNQAAGVLTKAVPIFLAEQTVKEVLSIIQSTISTFDSIHYIYIVDAVGVLKGVISIKELMAEQSTTTLTDYTQPKLVTARPHTKTERVAHLAIAHNIAAVPVVDAQHVFLGVVTSDTIMDILQHEHTKDMYQMAGIKPPSHHEEIVTNVDEAATLQVRRRLPWLVLGLFGGVAAAVVVEQFEHTLSEQLILAAFIPAVVYIADAVGSQTQMIFVRALSMNAQLVVMRYAMKEAVINLVLGTLLSALIALVTYLWLQSLAVTLILSISIFLTVAITVIVAIVLPYIFFRLGKDPAVASGPLATVIRDIMSLLIYLAVATMVLSWF